MRTPQRLWSIQGPDEAFVSLWTCTASQTALGRPHVCSGKIHVKFWVLLKRLSGSVWAWEAGWRRGSSERLLKFWDPQKEQSMPSRSKAVNSAAVLRCEFSVPEHAPAQSWNRQIGAALVRRSLSLSQIVVAAIGLFGTLASSPVFAQVPQTMLRASITRQASQLVTGADGGSLDLITFGTTANYTVTIMNVGASRAYSVSLTGAAPPGPTATRITAVTGASCTISTGGSTFTCANLGDLPDGILADGGLLAATSTTSTSPISIA